MNRFCTDGCRMAFTISVMTELWDPVFEIDKPQVNDLHPTTNCARGVASDSRTAWRPGPHPMWAFAQSALVNEDDGAPFAERFFLIGGQRYFFQRPIACSCRSSARPAGRWQLQLSLRRMRQTWSSWYRTPVRCSMSSRTRIALHNPLVRPKLSGPRLSARSYRVIAPQ